MWERLDTTTRTWITLTHIVSQALERLHNSCSEDVAVLVIDGAVEGYFDRKTQKLRDPQGVEHQLKRGGSSDTTPNDDVTCHQAVSADRNSSFSSTSSTDTIVSTKDADTMCVICEASDRTHAFFPCGHMVCCSECTLKVFESSKFCCLCRAPVKHTLRIFRS
eukprot:PhF_6_TR19033/c0_g2_i1/m.27950